jgi:hypothetical protein
MGGWDQNESKGDWRGGVVEWIHLAQERYRWQAVVNAVMNLRVLLPRILLLGYQRGGRNHRCHITQFSEEDQGSSRSE